MEDPVDEMDPQSHSGLTIKNRRKKFMKRKQLAALAAATVMALSLVDAAAEAAQAQRQRQPRLAQQQRLQQRQTRRQTMARSSKRLLMFARDLAISPSVTPLRAA